MIISELLNMIWKNPRIDDSELSELINEISQKDQMTLLRLNHIIKNQKMEEWLSCRSNINDIDVSEGFENAKTAKKIRDILVSIYLSEHRLDELLYHSEETRSKLLNNILKEWKIDKDLIMPIYLNRSIINRHFALNE